LTAQLLYTQYKISAISNVIGMPLYLVEWAIALHGMYESTLVLFHFKIEEFVHSGPDAM